MGHTRWLDDEEQRTWRAFLAAQRLVSDKEDLTSTESVGHGRAKRLEVTLPEPRAFEIDGEEIGLTRSFTVSIQPAAISVR